MVVASSPPLCSTANPLPLNILHVNTIPYKILRLLWESQCAKRASDAAKLGFLRGRTRASAPTWPVMVLFVRSPVKLVSVPLPSGTRQGLHRHEPLDGRG